MREERIADCNFLHFFILSTCHASRSTSVTQHTPAAATSEPTASTVGEPFSPPPPSAGGAASSTTSSTASSSSSSSQSERQ